MAQNTGMEAERAEFEAWAIQKWPGIDLTHRHADDEYWDTGPDAPWAAWQAARLPRGSEGQKPVACKTCGGYGYARGGVCWTCGGSGKEPVATPQAEQAGALPAGEGTDKRTRPLTDQAQPWTPEHCKNYPRRASEEIEYLRGQIEALATPPAAPVAAMREADRAALEWGKKTLRFVLHTDVPVGPHANFEAAIDSALSTPQPVAEQAPQQEVQAPTYTEGHCQEKRKPGGCQLHNLHCGYPKCDRRSTPQAGEKP